MSISRRKLILSTAAGLVSSQFLTSRVAFAQTPNAHKKYLFIFLRGGVDGLAWVPPHGDRNYERTRENLAFESANSPDGLIDLDGHFGLNPAMDGVANLFEQRQATIFHAIATPYRSRSHFDAQDVMENGSSSARGSYSGWLNRTLLASNGTLSATSLSRATPLILSGKADVGAWSPKRNVKKSKDYDNIISSLYAEDKALGSMLQQGLEAERMADNAMRADKNASRQAWGAGNFGRLVNQAARMMTTPTGPNISFIEVGGWDTHANQGTNQGPLFNRLRQLDNGLAALPTLFGEEWKNTVVTISTEFGRTAKPNGTGGTDHGTATAMMMLGGGLNGGKVISNWPSLRERKLFQNRDLAPTADTRSVFKAILSDHLQVANSAIDNDIFPDSRDAKPFKQLFT